MILPVARGACFGLSMPETSMSKDQMNQLRNELRECFRRNAGHWGFDTNQYQGYAVTTMNQRALFDGNGNPTPDF